MILSPVHPFSSFGWFIYKPLSIKSTYKILGSATAERPSGVNVTNQYPLLQFSTLDGQFNQIRTFPYAAMSTLAFTKTTFIRPVFQISRRIDLHFLSHSKNHNPFIGSIVPKYFRIAEVTLGGGQDRITCILLECPTIIQTISHALHLTIAGRSIESYDCTGTKACRIIFINHTWTTEYGSQCIRCNGYRLMFPTYKVCTSGMSPMHISPHWTIRIVLIEQMVNTIFIHHAIRIIHPAILGSKVIKRTEVLTVCRIKLIRKLHFIPANSRIRNQLEVKGKWFIIKSGEIYWNKVVYLIYSQTNIHVAYYIIVCYHIQFCFRRSLLYGKQQEFLLIFNLDNALSVT